MPDNLHEVIATDLPPPVERAPLELDDDITRKDAWLFAPLIAAAVALPLVATVALALTSGISPATGRRSPPAGPGDVREPLAVTAAVDPQNGTGARPVP